MRAFVTGWYGHGNIGDELLSVSAFKIFYDAFGTVPTIASVDPRMTSHSITSLMPDATPRVVRWPESASFSDVVSPGIIRTLASVIESDCVAIGGGGMLSDWKGSKVYRWLDFISLCKKLRKKTILAGVGAGPFFDSRIAERIGRTINNDVDLITTRDMTSKAYLEKDAGVTKEIGSSTDLAFYIWNLIRQKCTEKRDVLAANFVPFHDLPSQYEESIGRFLVSATKHRIVELLPFHSSDLEFHQRLSQTVDSPNLRVLPLGDIKETIEVLGSSTAAVLTRFHSIILAATLGVPMVPLVYHHKSAELVRKLEMDDLAIDVGDGTQWKSSIPSATDFQGRIESLEERKDEITTKLKSVAERQHHKSREQVIELRNLSR